jgi:hypothetical protein
MFVDPSDLSWSGGGLVDLQSVDGSGTGTGTGSSSYASFVATGDPRGCSLTVLSNMCARVTCSGATPMRVSAGTINVTGGSQPVSMQPDANNLYGAAWQDGVVWWKTGAKLHIAADGSQGGFPAFAVDMVAPRELFPDLGSFPKVNAHGDISLTWIPAADTDARVVLKAVVSGAALGDSVTCIAMPSWGHATIPGEIAGLVFNGVPVDAQRELHAQLAAWKVVGSGSQRTLVNIIQSETTFILH